MLTAAAILVSVTNTDATSLTLIDSWIGVIIRDRHLRLWDSTNAEANNATQDENPDIVG